ncbi:peptidoglycan-binding protein [Consotaella aegiceratis]|uniref:peptidoglycan-binding protein n=1 Tax=Consotaella aegiceratis TaxID=3097961 RepID=UPI002F3F7031
MRTTSQTEATAQDTSDGSSLTALNRTLEDLETRLAKLTAARRQPSGVVVPHAAAAVEDHAQEAAKSRGWEDAASEFVMQRRMQDQKIRDERPRSPTPPQPVGMDLDDQLRTLARQVEAWRAEGTGVGAMAGIADELRHLRREVRHEAELRFHARLRAVEEMLMDLRGMVANGESMELLSSEMTRMSAMLDAMADEGADEATIERLRVELEEIRTIAVDKACEQSVTNANDLRRRMTAAAVAAEEEPHERTELKQELQRLRDSLRSLAKEDDIREVARRWEDFQALYNANDAKTEESLRSLLKDEFEALRAKLEKLASEESLKAVEERWDGLEERFANKDIERNILRLGERMEQIEASLARIPENLAITPLEERIHALALGIDALARRQQEPEVEQFKAIEDRLDEISHAIIAVSRQAVPVDMAPIERIEARIATLAARVDRLSDEGEAQAMSQRIAELSQRIDALAEDSSADDLAGRVQAFAERLEAVFAEIEQPQIDTSAIEARLAAMMARLEDAAAPQVDAGTIRSLEDQIARLSEHLGEAALAPSGEFDKELDRRLSAIEHRLDENRETVLSSARAAADEAVSRMIESGRGWDNEHVARLSEDLRALEVLARETDERANDVFEAMHGTLIKIVGRLDQIESEIVQFGAVPSDPGHETTGPMLDEDEAEVPPQARIEPSFAPMEDDGEIDATDRSEPHLASVPGPDAADIIDDLEANRPLAPGSGMPNVAALLDRVRAAQANEIDQRREPAGKADFIAAARRAAMAAAAEADELRANPSDDAETEKGGLAATIGRRRKPILMAVGAVILALMAMPLGRALLNVDQPTADEATNFEAAAVPAEDDQGVDAEAAKGEDAAAEAAALPDDANPDETIELQPMPESLPPLPMEKLLSEASLASAPAATPAPMSQADEIAPEPTAGDMTLMQKALAKLPAEAQKPAPEMPSGIGTQALADAAKASDPKALFEVGLRLMEGRNGEPDVDGALVWFSQAARLGFAPAQYSLGTLYEKGNGVERDTVASRDWYTLAADQGNVRAMHNLAVLYATGVDGKSEPETAAQWFLKAAEHGMRDSQYNLGILYARGAGVEQDMKESYRWFAVAAKSGDADAKDKMEEVAKSLLPATRDAVQAEVDAWTPQPADDAANAVEVPPEWSVSGEQTASVDMKRAIRNIQAILIKLGFDPGTPDGIVGNKTTSAIMAFQEQAGLEPTGEVDEALIRALLEHKDG